MREFAESAAILAVLAMVSAAVGFIVGGMVWLFNYGWDVWA